MVHKVKHNRRPCYVSLEKGNVASKNVWVCVCWCVYVFVCVVLVGFYGNAVEQHATHIFLRGIVVCDVWRWILSSSGVHWSTFWDLRHFIVNSILHCNNSGVDVCLVDSNLACSVVILSAKNTDVENNTYGGNFSVGVGKYLPDVFFNTTDKAGIIQISRKLLCHVINFWTELTRKSVRDFF